jgi:hypothetical protein
VARRVERRSAHRAGGTPASRAAMMNAARSMCGWTCPEAGVSAAVNLDALPGTSIVIVVPVLRAECSQALRLRHRRGLPARALLPPRHPRVGVWRSDEVSWNPGRPEASIGSTEFPPAEQRIPHSEGTAPPGRSGSHERSFETGSKRADSSYTVNRPGVAVHLGHAVRRFLSGRQWTLGWLTARGPWRPRRRRRSTGRERWRCLGT